MTKKKKTRAGASQRLSKDSKLPFLEHFKELKRRLTIVAVSITAFGTGAYFIQQHIVQFLLRPAAGQHLIYTSPGGGLDFLFRVCIYTGIVCSLPIIIYQILKYLEPVMGGKSLRFALGGSAISAFLALAGMTFGYLVGLPATLHFLFHQFTTTQVEPLIAAQSYMHFVSLYMFGAALLFQVPLVLLFINRIVKLKPRSLIKHERWFILGSFILAVLMNPTPNVVDQIMLAGPMIVMYQVGIVLIALVNRPTRISRVSDLLEQDAAVRAERLARVADAKEIWREASDIAEHPARTVLTATEPSAPQIVKQILNPPKPIHPATPRPTVVRRPVATPVRRGRLIQ